MARGSAGLLEADADDPGSSSSVMFVGKHIHYSEVDRKPLCSYSPKLCKQRRLNGYAFCIRHVLEDRSAPFRQCEYVAKYNNQRCTNPIPKTQDRKYCSSHLQVMGVLPKKERKKKQDALESLALNITVPSLALKASTDLDHLPLTSPSSLISLLPLDPYTYFKSDKLEKESLSFGNKALCQPIPSSKQKPNVLPVISAISQHSLPSPHRVSFKQTGGPTQTAAPCKLSLSSSLEHPSPPSKVSTRIVSPSLTKPSTTKPNPEMCLQPIYTKVVIAETSEMSLKIVKTNKITVMRRSQPSQLQAPCLVQLHRLMEEQRKAHSDLRPYSGLDHWTEDSAGEEEWKVERMASAQLRILQEKCAVASGSRAQRLTGLCSYLRQRHKHLLSEERSHRRKRKSQHPLRKALLQAATHDPKHTADLIQNKLSGISRSTDTVVESSNPGLCVAEVKDDTCTNRSLPYSRHCFQHILQNRSQHLFSSCTARFADGAQCSVPVFDITHQTPLCEEHAKKMDNFLRGDVSRRTYQQQLQQHRRLKKAKLPALSKKPKKKSRRTIMRRPQKPIPPALPQGSLGIPSIVCIPTQPTGNRRSFSPDLSATEIPEDITSDISDIPHDLDLNQEDFSDVLSRFPDDLQDFDLFEGKPSELLPTSEEAEELVRVLQDMGSYPESLACLSSMVELGPVEGSDCRGMEGGVMDLLGSRLSAEALTNLELDPNLLSTTEAPFPSSPPSPASPMSPLRNSSNSQRHHSSHTQPKDELVGEDISHGSWGVLALPLSDSAHLHNLIASDGLLMSTALSTPPTPLRPAPCQPATTLSALPESSLTIPVTSPAASSSSSSSTRLDFLFPGQLKHTLPSLFSHCGIPADLQPHHSTPAPSMDRT